MNELVKLMQTLGVVTPDGHILMLNEEIKVPVSAVKEHFERTHECEVRKAVANHGHEVDYVYYPKDAPNRPTVTLVANKGISTQFHFRDLHGNKENIKQFLHFFISLKTQ